jgi:hypothetical protein
MIGYVFGFGDGFSWTLAASSGYFSLNTLHIVIFYLSVWGSVKKIVWQRGHCGVSSTTLQIQTLQKVCPQVIVTGDVNIFLHFQHTKGLLATY